MNNEKNRKKVEFILFIDNNINIKDDFLWQIY